MKTLKPAHIAFINGMITHGNRIRAYMEAYPGSAASSAKANACRLMKNPLIRQHIDLYYEIEEEKQDREEIDRRAKRFTDFIDSQQSLWDIANGEPIQKKNAAGILVLRCPSVSERLSAIFTALGNEKRFLRQYPQFASWLEENEENEDLPAALHYNDNAKNEVHNLLLPREQRLSFYMQHVSRQSLYRKGF